ncbi:hypothetical protein AB0L99_42600 [Streptomyces sp. NPDC051954]|uniref:hypothetical protein n=1 Tax=Streptomyces sp. NPDC051954 TaxID=3155524 RepID=UPI003445EBA6
MAETIHVRGEGGAIFAMDLPLPEAIGNRLASGLLVRVNEDGSPHEGAPAQESPTGDEEGSDLTEGRPPRPAVNASKSEWIAHVVARGLLSADDAANLTKADLIELAS